MEVVRQIMTDATTFEFRAGTCDENVYHSVYDLNEYRLPDRFEAEDKILDVGAHIGSFAKACIDRGAGMIYCFEPDTENFLSFGRNLAAEIAARKIDIFPIALWRSDRKAQMMRHSGYTKEGDEINTGGGDIVRTAPAGKFVPALPFHDVVQSLGLRRIRLLKLDCEYSEWPILYTSPLVLAQVNAICGEYHELAKDKIPFSVSVSGEHLFDAETLRRALGNEGFKVELAPTAGTNLGKFWAWKKGFDFKANE